MARVTVEDCIVKVPNRFELVAMAAQRARDISSGSPLTIEKDNDKNPVVALREIADETISLEELRESLITGLQTRIERDELDEEELDFVGLEQENEQEIDAKNLIVTIDSNSHDENNDTVDT